MRPIAAVLAGLAVAPAAHAACAVEVSASRGAAPLRVSFHAACDSATYRWNFGDRTHAEGATATHAYAGGRFTPSLTTDAGAQRLSPVTAVALSVVVPRKAAYGSQVTLYARVVPQLPVRLGARRFTPGR